MNSIRFISLFCLFLLLVSSVQPLLAQPSWVKNRPISAEHYIGIGMSVKSGNSSDYIQAAKETALSDLASEITINISNEVFHQVVEKAGVVAEEFKSQIQSSTKAELEGYELIDSWENSGQYWVYYRLSKQTYQKNKEQKLRQAASLSRDLFQNSLNATAANDIDKALIMAIKALYPIEKYLTEPLETEIDGRRVYLMNELYGHLQDLLTRIELVPQNAARNGKVGKALSSPLEVSAQFRQTNGQSTAISNLPLVFSFIRGNGQMITQSRSNRNGLASSTVSKITATDNLQLIKVELDMSSYSTDSSPITANIIKSLPLPAAKFTLTIAGVMAVIEAEEISLGQKSRLLHVEPIVKNHLSSKGFSFVDSPANADLLIRIKAESHQGQEVYGMFSAFVDLNLSVIDLSSGNEVYKGSLQNVKGIDLNYEKGSLKALKNAADKVVKEMIPEMLQKIQN